VRNCHKLGEFRPPEERNVCRFKIGYLKLHVLSAEVLSSLKSHGKSDLADRGHCYPRDYSVERSLTQTQLWDKVRVVAMVEGDGDLGPLQVLKGGG
jgi:hypothetical protein